MRPSDDDGPGAGRDSAGLMSLQQEVVQALDGVGVDVHRVDVSEEGTRVAVRAAPAEARGLPPENVEHAMRMAILDALPGVRDVVVSLRPAAPAPTARPVPTPGPPPPARPG